MDSAAQSANVVGNDNIVVQSSDSVVNVNVGARPFLRLTQFETRTRLAVKGNSEVALLSAYRSDVVPLLGREGALADLRGWLDRPQPVSVRVLVGAGGRGKTRLALELARSVSDSWLAGFATADELDRFRGQYGVEQWRWNRPVLVVVDYAASRAEQLRAWVRELAEASLEDRPRLRLLLLERHANRAIGWFTTVFGQGDRDDSRAALALLDPQEPVELAALDDLEFRRQVFGALLTRANPALAAPAKGADREFDRLLGDHKWAGDPLYLMMAGLASAKSGAGAALALSRADLALTMARNEFDRIGRIGAAHGVDDKHRSPGAFVCHMAAMATLTQGLSLVAARKLAASERAALGSTASLDATIGALMDALPAAEGQSGVAAVLPDVVGEAAILTWFGSNGGLAGSGVEPLLRIAAAADFALGPVSATLVRTAQDFAPAGYAEPVRWLEALASTQADLGALMEIANALPSQSIALQELAVALHTTIVRSLQAADGPAMKLSARNARSLLASSFINLGKAQGEAGHTVEALASSERAAGLFRELAQEQPDHFRPALARALHNVGVDQSRLGRPDAALATARESADLHRLLASDRPEEHRPGLARSLNNLALTLSAAGRHDEALATAQEAVATLRPFAARHIEEFESELADFLSSLGGRLAAVGRREDAVAAALEATDIHRRLAAIRPDAFLPDLAMALNNLGNRLTALDRRGDALAAAQEAAGIYQRLAQERSGAFLPALATALNTLANASSAAGLREEALAAAQAAVTIRRRLVGAQPEVYLPDLATSLTNVALRLTEFGRPAEAVAPARESTDIFRTLAKDRPDAFLPDLALSLNNLGKALGEAGLVKEALEATQEAVASRRLLAKARPDVYLPYLARSLNNLGSCLKELDRRDEALMALQEAVDIYRSLAAERPEAFSADLALLLANLALNLDEADRTEEALAAATEGMARLAPLFLRLPPAYAQPMALVSYRYYELSEKLGREMDMTLLGPVYATLQMLSRAEGSGG